MQFRVTIGPDWDSKMFDSTEPVFERLSNVQFKRGSEISIQSNVILVNENNQLISLMATIGACRQFET
jgi:hypothetical protein